MVTVVIARELSIFYPYLSEFLPVCVVCSFFVLRKHTHTNQLCSSERCTTRREWTPIAQ